MQVQDIYTVQIDQDMINEARLESEWLNENKTGEKTRSTISNHNLYGSLGHQAVEKTLDRFRIDYDSTRKTKYKKGDKYDIKFDSYILDIKATHGVIDQWYYNKQFLVFQAQLDDPKINEITHFTFTMINPNLQEAYIFGVIELQDFLDNCKPVKLKFDNQGIRSHQLKPFKKLMLHI